MQNTYPFELSSLKSSNVPMATVQRGDVVRIADSDLDYLRDFFNERFDGQPIKLFSKRFAIAVLNDMHGTTHKSDMLLFLVRAFDDGKFIQVDMYQKSVGDQVLWTEVLDNSKPMRLVDGGHYYMESYSVGRPGDLVNHASYQETSSITTYISDIVHYVIFFMQENLNNPEYVTKKTESHSESTSKPAKKGKKKPTKKVIRSTMYVPKRVTVKAEEQTYTLDDAKQDDVDSGDKEKRSYTGHTEAWSTRGHKRRLVAKDGSVRYVDVRPSVHKRNPKLMVKGQEKGVDIKLRPKNKT